MIWENIWLSAESWFTIQNVPIKLNSLLNTPMGQKNLQYKMFLLNLDKQQKIWYINRFTIQNVPIKWSWKRLELFKNNIYNTKCSY